LAASPIVGSRARVTPPHGAHTSPAGRGTPRGRQVDQQRVHRKRTAPPIRRSAKLGSQTYSVGLGNDAMSATEPVRIAYTYRTVTALDRHVLRLRVDQPTRGLAVDLEYSDTNIGDVDVLDYFASSDRVTVNRSVPSLPGKWPTAYRSVGERFGRYRCWG
jgi:hypothetical protein